MISVALQVNNVELKRSAGHYTPTNRWACNKSRNPKDITDIPGIDQELLVEQIFSIKKHVPLFFFTSQQPYFHIKQTVTTLLNTRQIGVFKKDLTLPSIVRCDIKCALTTLSLQIKSSRKTNATV